MKPSDLEEAARLCDSVKEIRTFLVGLRTWRGEVRVEFGGYRCAITAPADELVAAVGSFVSPHEALIEVLHHVLDQSIERLSQLGVETGELGP